MLVSSVPTETAMQLRLHRTESLRKSSQDKENTHSRVNHVPEHASA